MSSLVWILVVAMEAETDGVLQALSQAEYCYQCRRVDTAAALQAAVNTQWDVVVVDVSLLSIDAIQNWLALAQSASIVALADPADEAAAIAWMQQGAQDYCLKGHLQRLPLIIAREQQQRLRSRQQVEQADHLAAIVQSCAEAIISIDAGGRVLTWNRGAESLYGYTAQEAMGQLLRRLIYLDRWAALQGAGLWGDQAIDHHQATHQRKDGSLVDVFLTVSLVQDRQGNVLSTALILRDLGERRRIEQMKEEFLAIVSHEFRTPLTSLQGAVELLLTSKLGELNPHGLRMLQIVSSNLDRLVSLTQNLLDLQTLEAGTFALLCRPHNLSDLMLQAAQSLETAAQQAQIKLHVATVGAIAQVDRDRLLQVLVHLLHNAIKFSAPGGQIWLRSVLRQNHAEISVQDEGVGIPPDQLEAIFQCFHQVDASNSRRRSGAGLGLAICHGITRLHNGRLWVESTLGQGSTFYLALPTIEVPSLEP